MVFRRGLPSWSPVVVSRRGLPGVVSRRGLSSYLLLVGGTSGDLGTQYHCVPTFGRLDKREPTRGANFRSGGQAGAYSGAYFRLGGQAGANFKSGGQAGGYSGDNSGDNSGDTVPAAAPPVY